MKLAAILVLSFVLVGIVGGVWVTGYCYQKSVDSLTDQVYSHLESVAYSRGYHIETQLELKKELVKSLALIVEVEELLLSTEDSNYDFQINAVNERLQKIIDSVEQVESISVVDKSGIIIAGTNLEIVGGNRSTEEKFLKARQGETIIRDIHFSPGGEPVMGLASPVKVNGEIIGFVFMRVDIEEVLFQPLSDKTGIGKTGETYLINKECYVVTPLLFVEDAPLKWKIDNIASRNCFSMLESNDEFTGEYKGHEAVETYLGYGGEEVIGAHYPILEMQWCLLAEINEAEILGVLRRELFRSLFILLVLLILFVSLAGYIVVRLVSEPIRKLTQTVDEVSKGKLDIQLPKSKISEVRELTDSLNRILASLKLAILKTGSVAGLGLGEAVEAKEKAERRFKDLVSVSGDWIWEVDKEGRYTFVSGKIEEILGYTPEEILGKTPFDTMPKDEAEKVKKEFERIVMNKEKIKDLKNCNLSKDGKFKVLLTNGLPILDSKGNLLGYRGIDKDITSQTDLIDKCGVLSERLGGLPGEKIKGLTMKKQVMKKVPQPAIKKTIPPVRKVGSIEKKLKIRADEINKKRINRALGKK